MAYKRLIAAVPVLGGQVVMSYGYTRHKPAGSLGTALKNLDRWGVDEIAVFDISRSLAEPDFSLLEEIREAAIGTPVAFGGGIRNAGHAVEAIARGCDRVIVERLICEAPAQVHKISAAIGQQAVIGAVPVVVADGQLWAAPAYTAQRLPWEKYAARFAQLACSELLVIDRTNEGMAGQHHIGFHMATAPFNQKLIWFGGLAPAQAGKLLLRSDTVGVAFGNPFLATELAAHHARRAIGLPSRTLRKVRPHADN